MKYMKKIGLLLLPAIAVTAFSGCRFWLAPSEADALKDKIEQLEQQLESLEQARTDGGEKTGAAQGRAPSAGEPASAPEESGVQSGASTTHTMEQLTQMVRAFTEKAGAAAPGDTAAENMERFFALKQEEKTLDHALDLHETELEWLYRQKRLTRDEYKRQDMELERLEDLLDDAEDRLERVFGIDD